MGIMGTPNSNKPTTVKPGENPLLGPNATPPIINPLTRQAHQAPEQEDKRRKAHNQTTFDLVPNLNHIKEDLGDYAEYGVGLFPQLQDQWDHQRAQNQSGWEHTLGFLNQAIIGEVIGGTVEGIGWLFEIGNWGDMANGEAEDVGNFLTEAGESMQEWTREATPIYVDPQQSSFAPWSSAWWASNGVSVASFASMLIPAAGTVRAVSLAGKGLGLAAKLGRAGKALGMSAKTMSTIARASKGIGTAVVSRHIENNMEASGVFKEQKDLFMRNGLSEPEAIKLAGEAAADTYNKNWAMLIQDIPQYMLLGSKFKAPDVVKNGLGKFVGKGAASVLTNKYVLSSLSEGGEEMYQYWVAEEAKHMTDVKAGLAEENTYGERMKKYAQNGEFWTAAFFGAMGGAAFEAAGPAVQRWSETRVDKASTVPRNITNHLGASIKHIVNSTARNQFYSDAIAAADEVGNEEAGQYLRKKWNIDTAISKLEEGTFEGYVNDLDQFGSMNEEEKNARAEGLGLDPSNFMELQANYGEYKADALKVKEIYDGYKNEGYSEATLGAMTIRAFDDFIASDRAAKADSAAATRRANIKGLDTVTPGSGEAVLDKSLELARIDAAVKMYDKFLKSESKEERIDRINKRMNDLKANRTQVEKELKEAEAIERTPSEVRADKRVIRRAIKDAALMREYNASEFNSMLSDEAQDEIDNLQSDKVQAATKHKAEVDSLLDAQTSGEFKQAFEALKEKYKGEMPEVIANAAGFKEKVLELEQAAAKNKAKANSDKQDIATMKTLTNNLTPEGKKAIDVDTTRKEMEAEGRSAADTEEVTSEIKTEQNINAAADAQTSVGRANYSSENIGTVLREEVITSDILDKTKKVSMLSMNWKSVRNGAERNTHNQVLSDIFESDTSPVGMKVELVPVEDGIRAVLLNEDGSWKTANGDPIGPYLHDVNDQLNNPNFTEAKRSQLAALTAEVEKAVENGQRVFTTISKRTGGHIQRGTESVKVNEALETIGYKPKVLVSLGGSLVYQYGNEVKSTDAVGRSGHSMLELKDLNGNTVVESLDTSPLTEEEASLIVDLYKDFENPKVWFNTPVENNERVKGLTYGQAFELLVYEGDKTFGTKSKDGVSLDLGRDKVNGVAVLRFGDRTIPFKDIEGARKDIMNFLMNHVARYVSARKTNLSMTAGTQVPGFTFMGKDYTTADQYNDYLFETGKVKTKLKPVEGKLFIQPTIEFTSALEITGAPAVGEEAGSQVSQEKLDAFKAWANGGATEATTPDNPFGGVARKKSRFSLAPAPAAQHDLISIEDARSWLTSRIPNIPVEVVEGYISVANKGVLAEGAFVNGMVRLSDIATSGTEYHEAFHAVSQVYLTEAQRTEMYEEARSRFGTPTAEEMAERKVDNELDWFEEKLADDFRAYVHSEGRMKFSPKVDGFFAKLWQMVKELFGSRSKTDTVFRNINRGYYATAQVQPGVEKMTNRALYSQIDGLSVGQFYDLVDTMMFEVVADSNLMEAEDISAITVESLSPESLRGYLASYYDAAIESGNPATANIFIAASQQIETLRAGLLDKFAEMNLKTSDEVTRILDSDILTEEEKTERLNTKPAFEYSGKDAATGNVKLLISMLPKLRSLNMIENEDGSMVRDYEINPKTGLPRMASPAATWSALAKSLSGIVDTYEYSSGQVNIAFDKMLDALDDLAMTRPEVSFLSERLRDPNYPMYKKVEFFSAFSKAGMNYYTARLKKKGQVKQFLFGKSDSRSASEQIRNEWVQSFKDRFYTYKGDGLVLDTAKLSKVFELMTSIQEDLNAAIQQRKATGTEVPVEIFGEQLYNTLRASGIELSESAFHYWIENQEGKTAAMQLKNAVTNISLAYTSTRGGIKALLDKGEEGSKPWVKNEDRILKLAETEALFRDDMSESGVLGADNAMYYTYSSNNFITKKIQEIKDNNELLEKLAAVPYNTNSVWIKELLNDSKAREKFGYNVFNNFREEAAGDTGSKFSDLKPADELALRINQTLKGRYSLLTAADKGVYVTLTGPSVKSLGVSYRNDAAIYNNLSSVDIIGNYFIDELARMQQVWNELYGPNPIPENERVQHYHTGKKHGLKSQLFPSLSPIEINEKGEMIGDENVDAETIAALGIYNISEKNRPTWNTATVNGLRPKIERMLQAQIEKELALAIEMGVIKTVNGEYKNVGLDSDVLSRFQGTGEAALTESQAIKSMLSDYVLNSIISNVETAKMFTGDPAYYKSLDDLKKRVPGIIAPGQDLFIHPSPSGRQRQTFNATVVNDIETKLSDTNKDIYEGYVTAVMEANGVSRAKAEESLSAYNEVNEADAQAYVTLNRYRDLMEMLGKWRPSMDAQFKALKAGRTLSNKDLTAFMQPLKGMYYDLRPSPTGDRMQPVYLKYSLAPLIPGLTRGTEMDKIREAMEAQGIDELVFNSGIKVGARGAVNIADVAKGEAVFTPMKLDNRNWKLQQDLSAKYMKKGKAIEGSQVLKNVLANIDVNQMYGNKTGAQVIEEFVNVDRHLSNLGRENLIKEFGIDFQEQGDAMFPVVDRSKLYPHLIKELKGEAPRYVIEALEQGVSLDAIPQYRKKIQQKLLSMVNKRTVKLDMPGGAFIQMSPVMLTKQYGNTAFENSDIVWLTSGEKLLPPRMTKDGKVRPGQVLVPHSLTKNITGFDSMTKAEQKAALQEAKAAGVLEGVGYRIPNQDMASTDYLEIAGVLPAYMGDTIVAYPSITAKTGSDYDIDKMYFMMPNYEIDESGAIKKVESDAAGSTKAAQNAKLDAYKTILTSPNTFSRLVTPIDAEWLKNDAKAIRKLKGKTLKMTDLQFFTGSEQYLTKRKFGGGKHGIGQNANHMVDHVLTQMAGVFVNKNFGIGHAFNNQTSLAMAQEKGGKRYITSNISAYLNANVDIAKDPYIFDLNNNTFTANTVMMLLRMGVKPEWVNRFMTQPIIEEYTNLTLNSEGRVNELDFDEKTKKPIKPIDIVNEKYAVDSLIPLSKDSMPGIEALEVQLQNPTNATQRQLLDLFLELQDYAKAVNTQLRASKSDTQGAGRTLVESMIYENLKVEALNDPRLGNVDKKFEGTMLDTYYKNSVDLSMDAFGSEFLGMSNAVKATMEQIGVQLGKFNITDIELATLMENEIYTFLMKDFELFKHDNPNSLFFGTNTVAQRLEFLQSADESPYKNPEHPLFENVLLKNLTVNRGENLSPDFVDIIGSSKRDKQGQEALSEAWYELITSENELVSEFGKDLIKYSFYSTGLNQTGSSFFDLIPPRFLEQKELGKYLTGMANLNQYVKGQDMSGAQGVGQLTGFIGRFYRNNWANNKIVPTMSNKAKNTLKGYQKAIAFQVNENSSTYVVGLDEHGRKVFYPYVKDGDTLYRLQGYRDSAKTRNAVYARASKRGYSEGRYRIKDYDRRPMDLDSTLGVELLEGQDYNVKYQLPVAQAPQVSEQRDSTMGAESINDMNTKIGMLKGMFNAEFVMDENIEGVANVKRGPNGTPIVTINPRKVKEDTVIHEVAHIYIDSLGGLNDPIIRAGLQQLQGSTAEEIVDTNYPDLTGEARAKEVLATAIGMEGARLFKANEHKKSRWEAWAQGFWAKVKAFFGLEQNIAKQMAREILTDRIRKGEHSLSEYTQEQRSETSQENADDLGHIQAVIDELKAVLQLKINVHEQKIEGVDEEHKELREKHVNNLNELLDSIGKAENFEALLLFVERAQKDTSAVHTKLDNYWKGEKRLSLESVKEMRDYVGTYEIVSDIQKSIYKMDDPAVEELKKRIDNINDSFARIKIAYDLIAKEAIVNNLLPYSTRNANLQFRTKFREEFQTNIENQGKKKGKELEAWKERRDSWVKQRMAENASEIQAEEREYLYDLLEESKADLNYFDSHILDPRGVNNQLIQLTIKQLDRMDYLSMREFQDTIRDAFPVWEEFMKGKKQAFPGTEQKAVYEKFIKKDKDGKMTNEYVDKFDRDAFKREMYGSIGKSVNSGAMTMDEAIQAFHDKNGSYDKNGVFVPDDKWISAEYKAMSESERKMFDTITKINELADDMVPMNQRLNGKLPAIKASTMEQFRSNGIKEALKEWRDSTFTKEEDETAHGMQAASNDSIKRKVKKKFAFVWANEKLEQSKLIPIFFRKELDLKSQSYDLFGMAMSNYYMSLNFKNKSKAALQLEVFRDIIKNQKVGETKNSLRKFAAGLGQGNMIPLRKEGTSNIYKHFEHILDDRLYGIREIDAGNITLGNRTVSLNKLSKIMSGLTSDTSLILNFASATTNLAMGHVQTFIEAGSRTYYSKKNVKNAHIKYDKDFGRVLADIGNEEHIVKSKTNLLMEHFDMKGEFSALHTSMIKDTKIKRLMTKRTAHGLNGIAEHNIQGVLMYSLLDNIKVMDSKGQFLKKGGGVTKDVNEAMSLDEAYTAKDGKLVLDPRVASTTRNRNTKSFSIEEEAQISSYLKYINADLNGNYDANNRSIWQRHVLGQQAMLMKKWIPRAMKRRFRGIQHSLKDRAEMEEHQRFYSEATQEESEGLYTTAIRYGANVMKSFKENKFGAFNVEWERLDDMQKGNLARMKYESGIMALAWAGAMLLAGMAEDDDDNQSTYFLAYTLRRIYGELSFFMDPSEMLKMMENPLLSMRTMSNLFKTVSGLMPWNITDRYKSGEDKGDLKIWNKLSKISPVRSGMKQFDRDFEKSYNYLLRGF